MTGLYDRLQVLEGDRKLGPEERMKALEKPLLAWYRANARILPMAEASFNTLNDSISCGLIMASLLERPFTPSLSIAIPSITIRGATAGCRLFFGYTLCPAITG